MSLVILLFLPHCEKLIDDAMYCEMKGLEFEFIENQKGSSWILKAQCSFVGSIGEFPKIFRRLFASSRMATKICLEDAPTKAHIHVK